MTSLWKPSIYISLHVFLSKVHWNCIVILLASSKVPFTLYIIERSYKLNSWFATTWQGGHVGGQCNRVFSRRIYMKIEFSSQRREMLLFLTTNMAAVTSRANQQLKAHVLPLFQTNSPRASAFKTAALPNILVIKIEEMIALLRPIFS